MNGTWTCRQNQRIRSIILICIRCFCRFSSFDPHFLYLLEVSISREICPANDRKERGSSRAADGDARTMLRGGIRMLARGTAKSLPPQRKVTGSQKNRLKGSLQPNEKNNICRYAEQIKESGSWTCPQRFPEAPDLPELASTPWLKPAGSVLPAAPPGWPAAEPAPRTAPSA